MFLGKINMMCDDFNSFSNSVIFDPQSTIMEFAKPAIEWSVEEARRMATGAINNTSGPGGIFPQVIKWFSDSLLVL
jgi:hypothetical protein